MRLLGRQILVVSVVAWLDGDVARAGGDEAKPVRIVAFGDSTTATHEGIERVYPQRLAGALQARGIKAEVINAGVGGNTTADASVRFQKDVLRHQPDVVVIQFGLNDSAIDLHEGKTEPRVSKHVYERNLAHFVKTLKGRGIRVILMTPNAMLWTAELKSACGKPPYDPEDRWGFNVLNAEYAESVRRLASAHGVPLIDVYQLFLDYDGVEGQRADDLLLDGVHPNDKGHRLIADALTKEVVALSGPGSATPPITRGYDIPLIDWAGQRHRHVIIDKEEGQYLGHSTTVLLEDNKTMIAVYPKGHGRGAIVMRRSTDAGLSWSERLPVPDNWSTSKEVPTIHRVIDPQGVKRLILFSGLYPIRMSVSEDDGTTWTPLEPIGDFGGIVTMSSVERLKDGKYMALFHDDGRFLGGKGKRTKFQVFKIISKDGGLTWGQPVVIAEHASAHLCEPGLVRSPDGSQMAVLLRENSRRLNSFVIFSDDEGDTWSKPRELPGALTGDRHVAHYAPDGRLVVTFRDMAHDSPTKGDFVAWVGTYDDIVNLCEGQYRVRLLDNHGRPGDTGYAGLELLPGGTFVSTTYCVLEKGQQPLVVSVRFSLDEIDRAAQAGQP